MCFLCLQSELGHNSSPAFGRRFRIKLELTPFTLLVLGLELRLGLELYHQLHRVSSRSWDFSACTLL